MVIEDPAVAVIVAHDGRLPAGALEAAAEAGGCALVVGPGAAAAAAGLGGTSRVWWAETPAGPAALIDLLAPALGRAALVILPASPDGRDLAPGLAAALGRPLLAGAVACGVGVGGAWAELLRADGQVVVTAEARGPAVATLMPGCRAASAAPVPTEIGELELTGGALARRADPRVVSLEEPDPATMDLAEAKRVVAGGAGLVRRGATDVEARATFHLLSAVAAAMGASSGATRVVTDAGWMGYERQIGTTGVTVDPDLYVALGISGASQHVGGLGAPEVTVSVNTDPSCPMTGMADLGLVADAPALLVELAVRLGVEIPAALAQVKA